MKSIWKLLSSSFSNSAGLNISFVKSAARASISGRRAAIITSSS